MVPVGRATLSLEKLLGFHRLVLEPLAAGLSLPDVFGEHLFWIDSDEFTGAAGEDFPALVADLSDIVVNASADQAVTSFGDERLSERNRAQIFHLHFASECDDVAELIGFAHGFVEDRRDDASVSVAWRSDVAFCQLETGNETAIGFVELEVEMHAIGIVWAATKTMVAWNLDVARVVSGGRACGVALGRHR
jgi:hypothetical protein